MSSYMERRREGLLGGNSWILAPGLTWNDVAAAYLFAGRGDAGNRRRSIAPGNPYPLNLHSASLTDAGLQIQGGHTAAGGNNTKVNALPIRSIIIAATGVGSSGLMMLAYPKGTAFTNGIGLASGVNMDYYNSEQEWANHSRSGASTVNRMCYNYSNTRFTGGILGCSGNTNLYINGSKVTTYDNDTEAGNGYRRCGSDAGMTVGCGWHEYLSNGRTNARDFTCKAALYYTVSLTAAHHKTIADRLRVMLGL